MSSTPAATVSHNQLPRLFADCSGSEEYEKDGEGVERSRWDN